MKAFRPLLIRPKVYLAGKISKHCWRNALVRGLREHDRSEGPIAASAFTYVGPFFLSCDHGCYHGDTQHGLIEGDMAMCQEDAAKRDEVIRDCSSAVADCDLLFAYISAHQCYGTVAEIAQALMLRKQVVICFAPGIATEAHNEFWFVARRATAVLYGVTETDLQKSFSIAVQLCKKGGAA